jgi:hypothetical protein
MLPSIESAARRVAAFFCLIFTVLPAVYHNSKQRAASAMGGSQCVWTVYALLVVGLQLIQGAAAVEFPGSWKEKVHWKLKNRKFETMAPLIGVISQPSPSRKKEDMSSISGPLVSWIEAAGGRVVPIRYESSALTARLCCRIAELPLLGPPHRLTAPSPTAPPRHCPCRALLCSYDASDQQLADIFQSINGLVLPGGSATLWYGHQFFDTAVKLLHLAEEANDRGTCEEGNGHLLLVVGVGVGCCCCCCCCRPHSLHHTQLPVQPSFMPRPFPICASINTQRPLLKEQRSPENSAPS